MRRIILVLLLSATPALAQREEAALLEAKQSFDEGQIHYLAGKFVEAAAYFQKAYATKAYPAFLFNEAVCWEKAGDLEKAIDRYARYVVADPQASGRAEVERRIDALRAKMQAAAQPGGAQPPPALPDVRTRGLVVVESKPSEANVYIDDRARGSVGRTPFSASLEGRHTIFVEMQGYSLEKKEIEPNTNQLTYLYIALSKEHYLGWVEIVTPGVPGADVYLDKRDSGAVGKTPYMSNLPPGKHKIWIERHGFAPAQRDIEILPGGTHKVEVQFQPIRYGYLTVMGKTTKGATIKVDEREIDCRKQYPCRVELPPGKYHVEVAAEDHKSYESDVEIVFQQETKLRVQLKPQPSKVSAYVSLGVGVAILGGGTYFALQSKKLRNELEDDNSSETTVISEHDDRISKGKLYAIVADGMFVVGGIVTALGIYYLLSDDGPDSIGETEMAPLAITPFFGPEGGGLAAVARFP